MEIIVVLVSVVFLVSLYDFFAARRWQQITSSERNEMVFEHRNREYGAYLIRKNYDIRMLIILSSVILGIGTVYGIYRVAQTIQEEEPMRPPVDDSTFAVAAPPEEETPPPPPEEPVPPMQKTIQFTPPVVTDDENVEKPTVDDQTKDTPVSTETVEGNSDFGGVPVKEVGPVVVEKVKDDEPVLTAEETAEFPGGMAALRKFLGENLQYPQTAVEEGIEGKVFLKFVVDEQGDISRVTVTRGVSGCKECDQEAVRVIKKMPRWKPGRNGGKPVKMYYNLPVTFKLQ